MNLPRWLAGCFLAGVLPILPLTFGATHALVGWNDLGMHCLDADFSVFSLLPPFNTIHAQLIAQGSS
ncbi:MAG: hypothetical protein M5U12_01925 [Verrucomicrobia bacterium]|nr:hypothetical protein [Verrucomicrobiota bacterium]